MSVILDALKKLEQEKKVRAAGPVRLSPDLLIREDAPRRKKTGLVVAAALVVAVGAGGVTWFIKRDGRSVQVAAAPAREASPAATPTEPLAPAPAPAPVSVSVSARQVETVATGKPAMQSVPVAEPSAATPPVSASEARQLRRARRSTIGAAPATAPTQMPMPESHPKEQNVVAAPAPTDLAVSGIAWQDSRGDRRAVVNGGLYGEGATVAGSKIVQIMQDRVRFSRDGRTFEVPLNTPFVR